MAAESISSLWQLLRRHSSHHLKCLFSRTILSKRISTLPTAEQCLAGTDLWHAEKEAKKEGFKKYLESSGAIDALTKVLVSLYEQNDKPSSSIEFIQQKLGGPTVSDYEMIQSEMSDLQIRYNELLTVHQEKCRELEELRKSHNVAFYEEGTESINVPQEGKHALL